MVSLGRTIGVKRHSGGEAEDMEQVIELEATSIDKDAIDGVENG